MGMYTLTIEFCHGYDIIFVTKKATEGSIVMSSYKEKILNRIHGFAPHTVFCINDFLDIAPNATVRQILKRLADDEEIKRVIEGFYYAPKYSELISEYEAVSVHELALAIARKYNWNIAPYNSTALNLLGLSTQVPTHYKYISSGRNKEFAVEHSILEFKKVNPGEIANMSLKAATVIQAIKSLGKDNISRNSILEIRAHLNKTELLSLMNEAKSAPSWIYEVIREVVGSKDE